MMVTFISQCEKKALSRTRRVLDAFADRIGRNTWQTVITQEGLIAVKKLLRRTASKNTAVSCHWLRSRSRSELLWVIGQKEKFNNAGIVPVNSTNVNRAYRDDRADWHYLPLIQSLTAIAALFHDWGKASVRFQEKLQKEYKGKYGDALRHEYVSCLLLNAYIHQTDTSTDEGWLEKLIQGDIDETSIKQVPLEDTRRPLKDLPPAAKLISWLILSHHRLPDTKREMTGDTPTLESLLASLDQTWGYANNVEETNALKNCLIFPNGLLSNSAPWVKELKRWAKKLSLQSDNINQILKDGSFRLILHHSRLSLMLGDHYFSSLKLSETGKWHIQQNLFANTQDDRSLKQTLDQHLIGVCENAKKQVYQLPIYENEAPVSDNINALKKRSPQAFKWQDKAATEIREWIDNNDKSKYGFFAVNMASTGKGKTFANAKVMLALSDDNASLRFILALGLRTLTIQTGDEYRQRIFQKGDGSDLAVLIGSKVIKDLHGRKSEVENKYTHTGSESQELLIPEGDYIDFEGVLPEQGLATVLQTKKDMQFLYAPVLACTIDHIMAATETTLGGRYILPCLRLLSSDLVIDEIDDFTGSDLIAIGRLIHLAGMLGRKVMISSATIPPAIANGYFYTYQQGWNLYTKTRSAGKKIGCAWIDEFTTSVSAIVVTDKNIQQQYSDAHDRFIEKRIEKLKKVEARRKANIVSCDLSADTENKTPDQTFTKHTRYFETIATEARRKHADHYLQDHKTGLSVSFGVIRMANVTPCVNLAKFLLNHTWPDDTEVRVMPYHSRQVLLLRHEQEKHLDQVLKRKEKLGEEPKAFSNSVIRTHLDLIAKNQKQIKEVLFILVATPVEEVGRDHDLDWAIIEPSSYRSIIQLAGRVRRHRQGEVSEPNIGLLQYNFRTISDGDIAKSPRFYYPGYESNRPLSSGNVPCFDTHDLQNLIDISEIEKKVDAIPRIQIRQKNTHTKLALLEHAVISDQLIRFDATGPETLQGYLTQHWYLTALPQRLNPFRRTQKEIHLYRMVDDQENVFFAMKDEDGSVCLTELGEIAQFDETFKIKTITLSEKELQRLWLTREYRKLLENENEKSQLSMQYVAMKFGEVTLPDGNKESTSRIFNYNDQLGLFKRIGGEDDRSSGL